MAIESLKCKECGATYDLGAHFACENCFGPLEVAYDHSALDPAEAKRQDPGRLAGNLALRRLPALRGPPRRPARARPDAAGARRPPRRAARARRRALDQERRRQPDPLLQGPRRRGRRRQGPGAGLRDRRLRLDRQPRQRRRRPRRRRRARVLRLRPRQPRGAEAARHRRSTGPTWSASAATTTTSTGSAPSSPKPGPGPSSTSTCGPTTPRARRRSPTRPPSSSAGSCPTGSSARSPRARSSPRSAAASRSGSTSAWSRASSRSSTAPRREGCSPVATAFAEGWDVCKPQRPETIAKSLAIGDPADGPYAVEQARRTGGAIDSVTDDEIRDGISLLAETTGIFTETAGGVTIGVLTKLAERGEHRRRRARRRLHHRRGAEDPRRDPR